MNIKTIPLSKYFEIVKPQYVFLRLIPLKSLKNNNSDSIISAVAATYKNIMSRVHRRDKKLFFTAQAKIGFYVYIEKDKVEFFFIVPQDVLSLIKDKIQDCWHGLTIQQVDSLPAISDGIKYYLTFRKEDAMSLASDQRSNVLLNSILGTLDIMEQGDRVGLLYNFTPCDQQVWRNSYDRTLRKLKDGLPIDREKTSVLFGLKLIATFATKLSEFVGDMVASFSGGNDKTGRGAIESTTLTQLTKKKRDARVVKTQVVAFSSSSDTHRQHNNAISIGEAFQAITDDNELVYHRLKPSDTLTAVSYRGADTIKMSPAEASNFVALPGRELLENFKCIENIGILQSEVAPELRHGNIRVGTNTYRGNKQPAYFTTDRELKHLPVVVVAPMRAGKTEFLANIAYDSVRAGECIIAFDFCGNCGLSDKLESRIKNKLVIDCSDFSKLQGLGYNEVDIENEPDPFKQYISAKRMTMQLLNLVDSINNTESQLTPKMDRYLEGAALIGFLGGGNINDVFQILQSYDIRHEFFGRIPKCQTERLKEYVLCLTELDGIRKTGEGENRDNLITGIIDRVNRLKQNAYVELMLKEGTKNNFDLVEEMQKSQLITLRMGEEMFSTPKERDIFCTYWISKIWLSCQIRERKYGKNNLTSVSVLIDELSQVPACQELVRSKLSQMAKFHVKCLLSCHFLKQIKVIRPELKEAGGGSFILIQGCKEDTFNELKKDLEPYAVEDLLSLPRYGALCLIKYEGQGGYARFTVKLPKKLVKLERSNLIKFAKIQKPTNNLTT